MWRVDSETGQWSCNGTQMWDSDLGILKLSLQPISHQGLAELRVSVVIFGRGVAGCGPVQSAVFNI